QPFQLFSLLGVAEEAQLYWRIDGHQRGSAHTDTAQRFAPTIVAPEQVKGNLRDLQTAARGRFDLALADKAVQVAVPDADLHHRTFHVQFPHPHGHTLRHDQQHKPDILVVYEVPRRGAAVAHALDRCHMV